MDREEFNAYCGTLKGTENVIQWGDASVWKVGGKIFAICSFWGDGEFQKISFKCSDLSYQILCELDDIVTAPYLARAGWVQLQLEDALSDEDVRSYLSTAHAIIADKLTKAKRRELGL